MPQASEFTEFVLGQLEAHGGSVRTRKMFGGTSLMPYFEVPSRVLEDAEELAAWVSKARHSAVSASSKPKPGSKRSRATRQPKR